MQPNTPINVKPINKDKIKMFLQVTLYLFVITVFEFAIAFTVPHEYKWVRIFIFIALTIVKAYYITWDFMHVRDEKPFLKNTIILPLLVLIPFLLFILLWEGSYIFDVMLDGLKEWDFDIY